MTAAHATPIEAAYAEHLATLKRRADEALARGGFDHLVVPRVIFYQPFDYWHVVPDAPSGWWVEHFDIHIIRKPEEALALLPKPAARCAILGETQSTLGEYAPNNPDAVVNYLEYQRSYKTPYEISLMREA